MNTQTIDNPIELVTHPESRELAGPMSASLVLQQVKLIQDVMGAVMTEGTHFGKIPGCGDKPSLYKAGAEKLTMTFRLVPSFDVKQMDYTGGHREFLVRCFLKTGNGQLVGEGVGSCSTMESKYRYRKSDAEVTDKPVPKAHWDARKAAKAAEEANEAPDKIKVLKERAQSLIGGTGHGTKKVGMDWFITKEGSGKSENENLADVYNTVLKMGKKRALVDATIQATSASDMFTQDLEDIEENLRHTAPVAPPATSAPSKIKETSQASQTGGNHLPKSTDIDMPPGYKATADDFKTPSGEKRPENAGGDELDMSVPWEAVVCHMGSDDTKGKKLSELKPDDLSNLQKHYAPQKDKKTGNFSERDLRLRVALDASRAKKVGAK